MFGAYLFLFMIVVGVILFALFLRYEKRCGDGEGYLGIVFIALPPILGAVIPNLVVISEHASDLGVIRGQHMIVSAQDKRIKDLESRIKSATPSGKNTGLLLNHDSPIKAIVVQLSKAVEARASAESEMGEAYKRIQGRKAGLFLHIVLLMGEK